MLNPSLRDQMSERLSPATEDFAAAVINGLSRSQKTLPCRFFYDARGSKLFEEITRLPEYYPTRTEAAILKAHAGEIANGVPVGAVLIEFGSGSSLKTEILLRTLSQLAAYIMIDVSESALVDAKARLAKRFPALDVRAIAADFSHPVGLPADIGIGPKVGFFPGSTIGNLTPPEAQRLLQVFRTSLAPEGRLIVGIDLKKPLDVLLPAYNDAAGVTAAFNLNLLARINREIEPAFDIATFRHEAIFNQHADRIEMQLISLEQQEIVLRGHRFRFRAGESIHTENSYKYSVRQFQNLARSAGWNPMEVWTDAGSLFSVHELRSV